MATCKECIYEPKCHSRIAFGNGTEWNGVPTTDMEERCKDYKNKSDFQVKHGQWEESWLEEPPEILNGKLVIRKHRVSKCSKCGFAIVGLIDMNYCPDCGAKMDGGDSD